MMECGHPSECWEEYEFVEEGEPSGECEFCRAIEERDGARSEVRTLNELLKKQAVIVYDGNVSFQGTLGYVIMYGGSMTQRTDKAEDIATAISQMKE